MSITKVSHQATKPLVTQEMEGLKVATHLPTPVTLFLYGVGLCLFATIAHRFWSWQRLRHIPGPSLASVSPLWMVRKSLTGTFHQHLRHVSEVYGTAVVKPY